MALKKITIVLVPEGTNRIKQLRIPRIFLVFVALFAVASMAFTGFLVRDYLSLKAKEPVLARLQKENEQQRRQFLHLAARIDRMSRKMTQLKALDHKLKVMVNLETSEDEGEVRGVGGYSPDLALTDPEADGARKRLVRLMHKNLDDLDSRIALGKQDKTELYKFLENQKTLLASTPSIWPTRGWLSSRFGYRISPFTGEREFHRGIDISTRLNAPIVAPADGIVAANERLYGYGRTLTIKHGHGIVTRYAHLQKSLVKKGQYVKRGETIALVGNTGRSTGPHLHYEVHVNGIAVDPQRYILN
ncbi:MAG: M23 family metallopeptidase [Deltaproteobacteria bacterium]|nr:M23 family metallopeptidase [Deltaproteobacteria bacterium]MBW1924904.1 M23 family metallopeptidase [Deltaproteobacteria bacterium]MBW1950563.1 M23 family metallopeptidase [Deltaproteobacteria bacterium]MBW2348643.1 M23 family metallopeptidase [Deltaproteobacteria bacterium]RLB33875.1 MAG: peptidase M24 [Deltaproteobacteria bacterium]